MAQTAASKVHQEVARRALQYLKVYNFDVYYQLYKEACKKFDYTPRYHTQLDTIVANRKSSAKLAEEDTKQAITWTEI